MDSLKNTYIGSCLLCSASSPEAVCKNCLTDMAAPNTRCPVCAKPTTSNNTCGTCLNKKPHFNETIALFNYQFPVNSIIKMIKYDDRPELIKLFACRLAEKFLYRNNMPEILVPTPLHRQRQQQRGYNQSIEIARYLSNSLGIRTDSTICKRIRNTNPQSTLSIKERKQNIKGAFTVNDQSIPRHVAIIDDVITSGSTANEIAKQFKRAGCEKISVWILARA